MKTNVLLSFCFLLWIALANRAAAQMNVVQPGDPIILVNGMNDGDADSGPPPAAEGVEHAIDGVTQKYLNFLDLGSGFIVSPSAGPTIVNGLRFYTANDAEPRDPASYVLEGSTSGTGGPWTTISSGSLSLPSGRNPGGNIPINPAVHFNQLVNFPNTAAFTSYRVTFPTLKNAASANSMQIGEVELLTTRISVVRQGSGLIINGIATEPANLALEASTDLVNWAWRAYLTADMNGAFQFVEPDITAPPQRFYRLVSAGQFPAGLVTWWRGENNYRDSFGPNHGSAFSNAGPTFVAGQRGQALNFNGTTEAMFIGSAPIPSPWTACFWVRRQDATEASAALLTDPSAGLKMEQWMFTRQVGFTAFGVA
ncbi:MAG: hypothetical protein L0Y58_24775, partial [Verrucomicrobia subdivision 3 bacterium]|nr:hypothetical protein [Limisphaerales bacterium]